MGAGSSIKLVERLGTTRVVTAGLAGVGALLATTLAWSPDMAYWPLGLWFFGAALSIGWIMGPATDAVMGAVPEEKSGVASAMNDVARQVAGALGVAVIGSLVGSLYATRVEDATSGLPAEQAAAASDSVGAAVAIAERLPEGAGTALESRRHERLHRRARTRAPRRRGRGGRRGGRRLPPPAGTPPTGRGGRARGAAAASHPSRRESPS